MKINTNLNLNPTMYNAFTVMRNKLYTKIVIIDYYLFMITVKMTVKKFSSFKI